ncbi:uncharacterized protein F5147DRAFT_834274 [Suillus discolor]|uniref:Nephrocystin 3-like N-terminal domain-containing protein n=1 Tax=Suillus discolor TaxID=1912936 RepID=A0A9P7FFA1_9AGAM|nr:uncharacterized protein F5147DRAFT_834274 [Suillus discolor]KAG2115151.1 hypothetical protein F5147DRAFT_834274 [Suillus discolor]
MSEGTWEKFSQVAVKGAEHDSRERRPHPKCLEGTRVVLLNHIYGLSDTKEMNRLIWLHGTAGVGKSAVAFTVAERMRGLKMTEETKVETRLGGTFFFSRKHTKRRTTGYFFMTLAYQLAQNFPSVQTDVNRAILKDPTLLDPDKSLRKQMERLFLQPLRKLQHRLRECPPLTFVVDALDECTHESPNEYSSEFRDEDESESELTELISLLAQVLRDPDLPSIHILVTSRSEAHICEAMQNEDVRPLLCEIPVKISGEGVTPIISLDGADVDEDIYRFLEHSFRKLQNRSPTFPQPTQDQIEKLAIRAGRRFIVASTMMKFIDDRHNDPRDRLHLMLELTSELLPGTEVYELYDRILSTCADPKLAYLHLSIVTALTDPLPISQISELLGPGQGRDVEKVLVQLRSVIDVPPNSSLPVNIYHSSSLYHFTSLPTRTFFSPLDGARTPRPLSPVGCALSIEEVIEAHNPQNLTHSLSFIVQPPEPMQVLVTLLWLRGIRSLELQFWLGTQDGHAWLESLDGRAWLQAQEGKNWLQIEMAQSWMDISNQLQTQRGQHLVSRIRTILARIPSLVLRHLPQTQDLSQIQLPDIGPIWDLSQTQDLLQKQHSDVGPVRDLSQTQDLLQKQHSDMGPVRDLSQTQDLLQIHHSDMGPIPDLLQMQHSEGSRSQSVWDPPQTQYKKILLPTRGRNSWLRSQEGKDWVQSHVGKDWVQTQGGQDWLQTQGGKDWLQTQGGRHWVQTHGVPDWLQNKGGRQWLQTLGGQDWLQAFGGRNWLQSEHGQDWLQTHDGQDWLPTRGGNDWLQTRSARDWLQTPDGRDWLQTPQGQMWRLTTAWVAMEEFSNTLEAIKQHHMIVPELSSQPAFQVIQQFKSLPDFLMFPVFLALRHQDHSTTSTFAQDPHLLPDLEIIHAMKTFSVFANKARERSQSSSDVLNYACQNWAVHTSRAPKPWDEKLAHIFKSFWDRHLLDWLERQWCVKDLQSCLTILAEGEKIAKEHLLRIPDRLNNQSEVVGVFEGEKLVKEHLLRTPGHLNNQSEVVGVFEGEKLVKEHHLPAPDHLNNQSEAVGVSEGYKPAREHILRTPDRLNNQSEVVGVSEGEKPAKECLLQTPGHLNDQSEVVGLMQRVVQSCITFLRMFKC